MGELLTAAHEHGRSRLAIYGLIADIAVMELIGAAKMGDLRRP